MTFEDVYAVQLAPAILYELLRERSEEPNVNISHRTFPSWSAHLEFIESRPYEAWYLIRLENAYAGAVYLTKADEIGVHLFRDYRGQGLGAKAICALMKRHPRTRYLANINPANARSIALFQKLGFRHLQQTYCLGGH